MEIRILKILKKIDTDLEIRILKILKKIVTDLEIRILGGIFYFGPQMGRFLGDFRPYSRDVSPIFLRSRLRRSRAFQLSFVGTCARKHVFVSPCDWRCFQFTSFIRPSASGSINIT